MKFLLIFLSSCAWSYDCVHEIMVYETYADCHAAQVEHEGYRTLCAAVVEGEDREFNIESIGVEDHERQH